MSTEIEYTKPLPTIEPETEEFWKAAKRHETISAALQRLRRGHPFPARDVLPVFIRRSRLD